MVHAYANYSVAYEETFSSSWLFENRIPLKPALEGVCSLANNTVAYEETQSNRVSYFRDFVFFVSKGNPFLLLFIRSVCFVIVCSTCTMYSVFGASGRLYFVIVAFLHLYVSVCFPARRIKKESTKLISFGVEPLFRRKTKQFDNLTI